jgi:hypothetical protein
MRTCDLLEQLEPRPLEILITADGCTDGTIEFVSSALPGTQFDYECARRGLGRFADRTMCEALMAMDAPRVSKNKLVDTEAGRF